MMEPIYPSLSIFSENLVAFGAARPTPKVFTSGNNNSQMLTLDAKCLNTDTNNKLSTYLTIPSTKHKT